MRRHARWAVIAGLTLSATGLAVFGLVAHPGDGGKDFPPVAGVTVPDEPAVAARTTTVEVRRGENFIGALRREGIAARVGHGIAAALRAVGVDFRSLKPRDTLAIMWNIDGEPVRVEYEASPWLGYAVIARDGGGWRVERRETPADVREVVVAGEVKRSLFEAVEAAGEEPQLVLDLVEMFSSDFDFTADTRAGDRFRLLVEKRYAGGTFVDYGRVLGAQYVSDGATLTGIAFEPRGAARPAYYGLDGRSLRKSFLKSPLEFSRVTSGFTYARPHPILGGTRPHLAIDYAAPVGTPVRAVADGVVVRSGWAGGNGISVLLRHRKGYETMYNHLSRVAVRVNGRVRQGQIIGRVGSTGLSTGPHLDYRVRKNGVWVNPLSEKFLPGEPIAAADRARFDTRARAVVRQLEMGG
jgi:murein DD-endopeptidase MepM/ murein hydrolase activator NlpD